MGELYVFGGRDAVSGFNDRSSRMPLSSMRASILDGLGAEAPSHYANVEGRMPFAFRKPSPDRCAEAYARRPLMAQMSHAR